MTPTVVAGQGLGELAAACAAGILTADEALRLAAAASGAAWRRTQPARSAVLPFVSARDGQRHAGPDLGLAHWQACLEPAAGWSGRASRPASLGRGWVSGARAGLAWPEAAGSGCLLPRTRHRRSACGATPWPRCCFGERAAEPTCRAAVGRLYAAGADLAWDRLAPADGQCVRLPTYPWQRQRLWAPRKSWANRRPDTAAGTGRAARRRRCPREHGVPAAGESRRAAARSDHALRRAAERAGADAGRRLVGELWASKESASTTTSWSWAAHSLLAAQLLSQLSARLQRRVAAAGFVP